MSDFLTNIGTIFSNLLNWLGQVSSYLITNPIFIIIIAISIVGLLINIIINIAYENENKKVKKWLEENYDYEGEWASMHEGAYYENGSWIVPLESNDDDNYMKID